MTLILITTALPMCFETIADFDLDGIPNYSDQDSDNTHSRLAWKWLMVDIDNDGSYDYKRP